MSKINIQGLKSIKDLSNADHDTYVQNLRKNGDINEYSSEEDIDRIFKNDQFYRKFGAEVFNSMSPEERDKYYNNMAVVDAYKERYGNDSKDFDGLYTPEAMKYLIENDYMTSKEREELAKDKERLIEEQRKEQPTLLGRIGQSLSQSRGVSIDRKSTRLNSSHT